MIIREEIVRRTVNPTQIGDKVNKFGLTQDKVDRFGLILHGFGS